MMKSYNRKGSCKAQQIPVPFIVPADQSSTGEEQRGNANDFLVEYDGGKRAAMDPETFKRDWAEVVVASPINRQIAIQGLKESLERQKEMERLNPPPTITIPRIGDGDFPGGHYPRIGDPYPYGPGQYWYGDPPRGQVPHISFQSNSRTC
jgi:hypothetical protein